MIQLKNLSESPPPAARASRYPDVYFHDPEEVKKNLYDERYREYNCYISQVAPSQLYIDIQLISRSNRIWCE